MHQTMNNNINVTKVSDTGWVYFYSTESLYFLHNKRSNQFFNLFIFSYFSFQVVFCFVLYFYLLAIAVLFHTDIIIFFFSCIVYLQAGTFTKLFRESERNRSVGSRCIQTYNIRAANKGKKIY